MINYPILLLNFHQIDSNILLLLLLTISFCGWYFHISSFPSSQKKITWPPVHHGLLEIQECGLCSHILCSVLHSALPISGWMVFLACGHVILGRQVRPKSPSLWRVVLFDFMVCEHGGLFAWRNPLWVIQQHWCRAVLSDLEGAPVWEGRVTPHGPHLPPCSGRQPYRQQRWPLIIGYLYSLTQGLDTFYFMTDFIFPTTGSSLENWIDGWCTQFKFRRINLLSPMTTDTV